MFEVIKIASHSKHFSWNQECEESFSNIKNFIASPPILEKPTPYKALKIYLSFSDFIIAAILVKRLGLEQKPVYFVSHMLKGSENCYLKIEKLIVFLIIASRKLRQYFQGRLIIVMTNQSLRKILHNRAQPVQYEFTPRKSMKSQVLSDFVAECNFENLEDGEISENHEKKLWTLFTDRSSTSIAGGAGVVLTSPDGFKVQQSIKFHFKVTNNEA